MLESKKFEDFKKEASKFESILLEYKKTGKQFVDKNFHPSLKIQETRICIDDSPESWIRVDEMYKAPLFQEDLIHPDYIKQGELGDCYLLASLSRIAKQSYLVPSLFDTSTPNQILGREKDSINIKCGAVVIYFNCFGLKTPVLIDTLLPQKYNQLRFSKPSDVNLSPWFCLVEKAYAKLYESYSNIIGGTLPYAIYNMFGYYPSNKNFLKMRSSEKVSNSQLFERILKNQNKGAVMGTSITPSDLPKGVTKEEVEAKGLIPDHCYLIIKVRKTSNKKFICLRNPWGGHEWNGDWSDGSPLWTPQLEKELKVVKVEDGTFWMCENDFFRYFTELEVSKPFPTQMYSKRFFYQLVPGDHDGIHPDDRRANFLTRPNFAFKITDPISKGEKCRFHILVERHHQLFDKKKNVIYNPPKYCVFLVRNGGKKIDHNELYRCDRHITTSISNLFSISHDVNGNDDIVTIVLHRLQKCNLIEDCYVLVFCDHEFILYDIDHPEKMIEYEQNPGIVFDNFSSIYPSKRKHSKSKLNTNDIPLEQPIRSTHFSHQNRAKIDEDKNDGKPKLNEINKNRNKPNNDDRKVTYNSSNQKRRNDEDLRSRQREEELRAKDREIKRMNEKMKEEMKARMKAEEDAKNANAEIEQLRSLLQKAQKQIREKEIENTNTNKKEQELNKKLNEVNQMKREIEKEKRMIDIEKQRIRLENNKLRHQINENDEDSTLLNNKKRGKSPNNNSPNSQPSRPTKQTNNSNIYKMNKTESYDNLDDNFNNIKRRKSPNNNSLVNKQRDSHANNKEIIQNNDSLSSHNKKREKSPVNNASNITKTKSNKHKIDKKELDEDLFDILHNLNRRNSPSNNNHKTLKSKQTNKIKANLSNRKQLIRDFFYDDVDDNLYNRKQQMKHTNNNSLYKQIINKTNSDENLHIIDLYNEKRGKSPNRSSPNLQLKKRNVSPNRKLKEMKNKNSINSNNNSIDNISNISQNIRRRKSPVNNRMMKNSLNLRSRPKSPYGSGNKIKTAYGNRSKGRSKSAPKKY